MKRIHASEFSYRVTFLDPAGGKREAIKSARARAAIVTVGADQRGYIAVLETWARRGSTNEIVEAFLGQVQRWGPQVAAYEDAGQQSLLCDPIQDDAAQRNLFVPLLGVKPSPGVDKNFRIRTILQPVIVSGRLLVGEFQFDLKMELFAFPMSPRKDLVDALAGAIHLVPDTVSSSRETEEAEALAAYLRVSGAPPRYIEQRMAEIGRPIPLHDLPGGKVPWYKKLYSRDAQVRR